MLAEVIRTSLIKCCHSVYGLEEDLNFSVEKPDALEWGDYASNISMLLAKRLKQSPMQIAENLSSRVGEFLPATVSNIPGKDIFKSINVAQPGFINFVLSDKWLKNVLVGVASETNDYGRSNLGLGKKVLVEFSQPNPNKPLHIGHARNNFLGSSIANIFEFSGYSVIRVNYLNDWGTHICKSMLMYKLYGEGRLPDKKSDHFVGEFYAMYESKFVADPSLNDQLAEMFRLLESGDSETLTLWTKIVNWAYDGWSKTYADENVTFDLKMYQHDYKDSGKEIVRIALDKGIAEKDSSGAIISRLKQYGIPDKVLLRADGTSIYSTQDLQLAKDSFEKYNLDRRIYVVDDRQSDYFRQIFKILSILGFEWSSKLFHLSYGVVKLPEGSMSSRKGNVITAGSVYNDLKEMELNLLKEMGRTDLSEDTIDSIALAAFRYGMLKVDPSQDIVFDMSKVSRFEGNTGPYILYTIARCNKLIDRSKFEFINSSYEYNDVELALVRKISAFSEVIIETLNKLSPHILCNYLFDLSQQFNSYYASTRIYNDDDSNTTASRVLLSNSVKQVLINGVTLLGIKHVERM